MEVPEVPRTTLVGLKEQLRPVVGDMVRDRATEPVKPFSETTVIVEVAVDPAFTVTLVGLAVTLKSWTMNVTVAE